MCRRPWVLIFALFVSLVPFTFSQNLENSASGARTLVGQSTRQVVPVRSCELSELAAGDRSSRQAAQSRLEAGATSGLVLQAFGGPSDSNYSPADPSLAAGPVNLIATINSRVAVFDKTGNMLSNVTLNQFMGQTDPTTFMWDTRTLYDQNSGRFFIVGAWGDQTSKGAAYLAVSTTSDATGGWNVYQLENNGKYWVDYPQIGVTANAVFISLFENPFAATGGLGLCPLIVIGKPELLSGSPGLNITRFGNIYGLPACGDAATPVYNDQAGNTGFLLGLESVNSLHFMTLDTTGTPTLTADSMSIPTYAVPSGGAQPGTSSTISPGASSILSAVWRNGSIWATQTVRPASGGNAAVRWLEMDPAGKTTVQSGEVSGVGDAYIGAVSVLPNGDVDLFYTTSSSTQFASAGYAHRAASDPPGAMPVSGVYAAGTNPYLVPRWGDFAGAAEDPDGNSAWGMVEIATGGDKGTAVVQLARSAAAPLVPQLGLAVTPSSATLHAGASANFQLVVTAQNLGSTVAFACSGLPTGDTCAFSPGTLATSGTVTMTINTVATTAGMKRRPGLAWPATALFAVIGLAGIGHRQRYLAVVILAAVVGGVVSCGGAGGRSQPSAASPVATGGSQAFALTVTAMAGATQASSVVSLTVQ